MAGGGAVAAGSVAASASAGTSSAQIREWDFMASSGDNRGDKRILANARPVYGIRQKYQQERME